MIYFNWLHSLSCLNLDLKNNIHFAPFHNFGGGGLGNQTFKMGFLAKSDQGHESSLYL